MRKRTKAREIALKFLYQIDITKGEWAEELKEFACFNEAETEIQSFSRRLIKGTIANLKEIDEIIVRYTENWQIKRMAVIDRNVLRLAAFELLHLDDIPAKVSINEAINLAKRYGDEDSGKFVNGILDRIKKELSDG
ncbi:MAG: transcription antitermination factor NusB [Candidatus Omnitrophica bacterium]|nr:transcription antitermination factor NusB [Candidatus Omnitrophota bacterium]